MWIKWFRGCVNGRSQRVRTPSRRRGGGALGREILDRLPAAIGLPGEHGEIIAALALRLLLRVREADPEGAAGVRESARHPGILVREIEAESGILEARGRALEDRLMALVERRARHRDDRVVGIIRRDLGGVLRLPGGEHV